MKMRPPVDLHLAGFEKAAFVPGCAPNDDLP
jgi:hypothetical protein